MKNIEISRIFDKIAKILRIQNDNPFKIRAYEHVAEIIENLPIEVETIYQTGKLEEIPGVGDAIAKKIEELIKTGKLEYFENLKKMVPLSVLDLLDIPEVGPQKVKVFYEELGIDNIQKLEEAVRKNQLQNLPGMGKKTEENILRGIQLYYSRREKTSIGIVLPIVEEIVRQLKSIQAVQRIEIAGSLRRRKDLIGDIDILVSSKGPEIVMEKFIHLPQAMETLSEGLTKSAVIVQGGIHVDLRVVDPDSFGAALQYFTGSKEHNVRLREMAIKKGLKMNEYGVFQAKDDQKIAGKDEQEIYHLLGLPFIIPEIRENYGEFEAALEGQLPEIVNRDDLKGDLHIHSNFSDGMNSIEEIVKAAQEKGYQYIAITDHSQSLRVAGGLNEKRLEEQIRRIEEINKNLHHLTILKGIEVDIKSDGSLDMPDHILNKLDIVIAAIHSGFKQQRGQIMERLIKAMRNPYVNVIAHPTGRMIGYRDPYDIDIQEIIRIASETNTALEINACPERMDLNDIYVKSAKEKGVRLSIGTDAHRVSSLDDVKYGLFVARRGWLEKRNVLNTFSFSKLKEIIKK